MAPSKFLACTFCAVAVSFAAACADGTGKALTPTLPSTSSPAANPDGSILKATSPTPQAPAADAVVANLRPTLVIGNAAGKEVDLSLRYVIELYEGDTLVRQTDGITIREDQSSWQVPANLLKYQRTYRWRARGVYNNDVAGPWSEFITFSTPVAPPVDGPVDCPGSSGLEIVKCVGRAYPAYLVATEKGDNSLERRKANMAFIRDRIIETGRCKGLDYARNLKRGGPEISFDFMVWKTDRSRGVDLATGYDELSLPIRLKFQVFGADENYGYPFYAGYPVAFDCSNLVPVP